MRLIYYDTETTGTRHDVDQIVEIAAFDPERQLSFVQFVRPTIPIPPEASAINGITDAMVASAGSFKEVGQAFIDFCSGPTVLIAHNNDAFDKLFLHSEYRRAGVTPPPWPMIDSLKWARKYRPDLPRHNLQSLREAYGIAPNQAHRALDDVMILYQIFSTMIDDLPLATVKQLLEQPSLVSRMPFGKYQGRPLSAVPRDYVRWLKTSGAFDKAENQPLKESFEKLALL